MPRRCGRKWWPGAGESFRSKPECLQIPRRKALKSKPPIHGNRNSLSWEAWLWLLETSHTWGEPCPLSWLWDLLDSCKSPAGCHAAPWEAIPAGKVLVYPRASLAPLPTPLHPRAQQGLQAERGIPPAIRDPSRPLGSGDKPPRLSRPTPVQV